MEFNKKTFNINRDSSDLMKLIIPSRKQTDFVNRAIKNELEREQEKLERKKILQSLKTLKRERENLPQSLNKKSEDVVREVRKEITDRKSQVAIQQKNDE